MGLRVKKLRKDKGLVQAEFAQKIGCDKRTILNIENGKVNLSPLVRLAICNVFWVRKEWLLSGEGEMYDDRWELLEGRAKELGEDIYYKFATVKRFAKEYEKTRSGEGAGSITGGEEPYNNTPEQQYVSKLRRIFREKDEGTRQAVMQTIDQFLRVAPEEPKEGEEKPPEKKAADPS